MCETNILKYLFCAETWLCALRSIDLCVLRHRVKKAAGLHTTVLNPGNGNSLIFFRNFVISHEWFDIRTVQVDSD